MLSNASAMIAEREALRMGIEHSQLIFKSSAQIGQYNKNLMRSFCVSSVFTGM